MDYKVFYRKYRPQSFDDLVGQEPIKELLLNSIINNQLSHAYLFTGPRGTGKTSTAKLFAKTINCEQSKKGIPCNKCTSCLNYIETTDIVEIDAASNNGVDEIRELRENVKILPSLSKYKVYIIDEVHMLSSSAWNAFLKTLEEPPHHVIFILATTEIQKIPITVLSRCQRFDFQRISDDVISNQIRKISQLEKIDITDDAIIELVNISDGALRDALSLLDQLSKLKVKIDTDIITTTYGVLTGNDVENIISLLDIKDISSLVSFIDNIQIKGVDASLLLNKLLERLLDELIIIKKGEPSRYSHLNNISNIIFDLEQCYHKSNKYLLIKTILLQNINNTSTLSNVEKVEPEEKTSESPPKKEISTSEIISQEIISDEKTKKETDELTKIRINNSYVKANINLKKDFSEKWKKFAEQLIIRNELKLLSLVRDSSVEVVSPTNGILSTEFYSNSVLFNSLVEEIESKLLEEIGVDLRLICLDKDTWNIEKEDYLKNRKTKKYELLTEPSKIKKSEIIDSAENLFGDDLIEIN